MRLTEIADNVGDAAVLLFVFSIGAWIIVAIHDVVNGDDA